MADTKRQSNGSQHKDTQQRRRKRKQKLLHVAEWEKW